MKTQKHFYRQFLIVCAVATGLIYIASCEKESEKPTGNNKVELTSTTASSVAYFSTTVSANLTNLGGNTITDHGFCYATNPNPDINTNNKSLGKILNTGSFNISINTELTGLNDNTKYYIRAYANYFGGTLYGSQEEVTTLKTGKPLISTAVPNDITLTSVVCGGTIESDSGYAVTVSGICWDTDNQFDENQCLGKAINTSGTSNYSLSITDLEEGTNYYVKAYANNQKGTGYGEIRQFTTLTITIPTGTTNSITSSTSNSAIGGGNITSDGNATSTARGVCWNTTGNPTLNNCINFTTDGQGEGLFTSNIINLNPSTFYYVKAYATNIAGTGYGIEVMFKTDYCGTSLSKTHTAGTIAPVNKTVNYSTVQTNLTGSNKCWITQNLGADYQAIAATDATESSAGWYWQFNRKQGFKHNGTTRTPNTTWITSISENSDWLPANDPCTLLLGSDWRLPTYTEWETADVNSGWDNYNETYASVLKLHAAGNLGNSNGSLNNRGLLGFYWSSSQYSSTLGWDLNFNSGGSNMDFYGKAVGLSLRCIRD